jgi:hypothetical protein
MLGAAVVVLKQANRRNLKYIQGRDSVVPHGLGSDLSYDVVLDPALDDAIFIKLLDNVSGTYEFAEIIEILDLGHAYFDTLEITMHTATRVQNWISRLGRASYIWKNLTNAPDYNLELLRSRYYPFFHVRSKQWKELASNAGAARENYPPTSIAHFEKGGADEDADINPCRGSKHNNYMGYPVLDPSKYGNIVEHTKCLRVLLKLGMNLEALEAFLRLCLTPSSCHIVKSPEVWDMINPLITSAETKNIVEYCIHYAYYIIRHESTKMFSQVRRSYRAIFTYAELLAQPDTHDSHMENDPHVQQLSDEQFLASTVPFGIREKRTINSAKTFERRLFLATGGALAHIDFKEMNASVSGSILIPCVTKSPLESRFEGVNLDLRRKCAGIGLPYEAALTREDRDFLTYLEYFYPSYDSLIDAEYIKATAERKQDIARFDMRAYMEEKSSQDDPDDRASSENIDYNKLADIDIAITATFDEFRERATILYEKIKANCAARGPVWMAEIETLSSFKFAIYGPGLTRPIDLFRIPYDSAKMVKKFHMPCVRMWYEGRLDITSELDASSAVSADPGLYIYDSCVHALKSGINDSYKWFSCNKIPADVILKYAERGFTTILNKKECGTLIKYMADSPRWSRLAQDADSDAFGIMLETHKFFYPALFNAGIRMDLRNNIFPRESCGYSKRQPFSYPDHTPSYGGNLAARACNTLHPPNMENITEFMRNARSSLCAFDSDSD